MTTPSPSPPQIILNQSEDEIHLEANLTTVKIIATNEKIKEPAEPINIDGGGSGFLFYRQEVKQPNQNGYIYFVLTNNHVIKSKDSKYYVRTHDGLIYQASEYAGYKSDPKIDLGVLWFHSPIKYSQAVVVKNSSEFLKKITIFSAGYECDLTISDGKICPITLSFTPDEGYLSPKTLQDGYRIALTKDTKRGTSGGPIFNKKGEVIGVNGRGINENLKADQYKYVDNSGLFKQDKSHSLGIPIDRTKLFSQTDLQPKNLLPKDYPRSYSFIDSKLESKVISPEHIAFLVPKSVITTLENPLFTIILICLTVILVNKSIISPTIQFFMNIFNKRKK